MSCVSGIFISKFCPELLGFLWPRTPAPSKPTSTCCDLRSCKLLIVEQKCKILDSNTPGIELLTLNKAAYGAYLNGGKVYPQYLDVAEYLDAEVRDKLNDSSLPLITNEWFFRAEGQSAESIPSEPIPRRLNIFGTDPNKKPTGPHLGSFTELFLSKGEPKEVPTEPGQPPESQLAPQTPEDEPEVPNDIPESELAAPDALLPSNTAPIFEKSAISIAKTLSPSHRPNLDEPDSPQTNFRPFADQEVTSVWNLGVVRIVFLHHGLGGSPFDMQNLTSLFRHYFPKVITYNVSQNEDKTAESILSLARRFAAEARGYLAEFPKEAKFEISFVGHSLGGLVIKASLPLLADYAPYFRTYMSLGSPHMGSDPSKLLVGVGMGILGRFKSNQSIREMSLTDSEALLSRLAQVPQMQAFRSVVFVCNYEDGYIRPDSAKALLRGSAKSRERVDPIYQSFYANIRARDVCKIGVLIPDIAKGLDKLVGRRPHVEFLQNLLVQRLVFRRIREFFD